MTTPTVDTPIAVDPVQLKLANQTLYTAGAGGAILDYIKLVNAGLNTFDSVLINDVSVGQYADKAMSVANATTADVIAAHGGFFNTDSVAQADVVYIGASAPFSHMMFLLSTALTATTVWEVAYGSGAGNPGTYTALVATTPDFLVDGTAILTRLGGEISFVPPAGWVTTTPNGVTARYFIRLKLITTECVVKPIVSQILLGTAGACAANVHYVNNGGTAGRANLIVPSQAVPILPSPAGGFIIPTSKPRNAIEDLEGRPFHMEPSSTLVAACSSELQVVAHVGGTDYA